MTTQYNIAAYSQRLEAIRSRIRKAARAADRDPSEITLVAVSKHQPARAVAALAESGLNHFGENQLPEGSDKIQQISEAGRRDLCWHFIGPLQSNKSRTVAEEFQWLQSLHRHKIARRLQDQRPDKLPPIDVLIQVNIDGEPQKAGIEAEQLSAFADDLRALDRLRLRGLMIIPKPQPEGHAPIAAFRRARQLFMALQQNHAGIDTLSMGMSADFAEAISEGSTMVRIGTALFGSREP